MTCDPAENNGELCFGGHNTGTSHQVLKTLLKFQGYKPLRLPLINYKAIDGMVQKMACETYTFASFGIANFFLIH